jgi:hypothetical protein
MSARTHFVLGRCYNIHEWSLAVTIETMPKYTISKSLHYHLAVVDRSLQYQYQRHNPGLSDSNDPLEPVHTTLGRSLSIQHIQISCNPA